MKTILISGFWAKDGEVTRPAALAQLVLLAAVLLAVLGGASWHS